MKTALKILIWIGCFIVCIFVILTGDLAFRLMFPGYKMGYLIDLALTWLFMFFIPKRLCAMLDVKAFEKEATKRGMTPGEYASSTFPPSLLDLCESNKNNRENFDRLMKQCIEGESITKADANVLRYMFRCR